MNKKIKYALISVSDKKNIIILTKVLIKLNVKIIATKNTAKVLQENNIPVTKVEEYTKYPEIMQGKVKTLHPKIYGGILAKNNDDEVIKFYNFKKIDLVVVNLYKFEEIISKKNISIDQALDNIDIGGHAILRASAKNYSQVTVIYNPDDYLDIIKIIKKNQGYIDENNKLKLACKAFQYITDYDINITQYLNNVSKNKEQKLIDNIYINLRKEKTLRYGENPHQKAALYIEKNYLNKNNNILKQIQQIQGKELSYNNILDIDYALKYIELFTEPCCIIIKHNNPCGASCSSIIKNTYIQALNTDKISSFGGVIIINRKINKTIAQLITQQFVEIILTPKFTKTALQILAKKQNTRLITYNQHCIQKNKLLKIQHLQYGGFLIQRDNELIYKNQNIIVTKRHPSKKEIIDLTFAWKLVKYIKSNAIVFAKNKTTTGIGIAQTSRIFSAEIAIKKAQNSNIKINHSVMASDAFFPFTDIIKIAKKHKITAIIQPGGSICDEKIIAKANIYHIAMIFTYNRQFNH